MFVAPAMYCGQALECCMACAAQDIRAGKAALRKVDAQALLQQNQRAAREDSLEARLREGLAKFRKDDTAGSSATEGFSP